MEYVLSYLAAGLVLALASVPRHKATIGQHVLRSAFVTIAWPILVLAVPELIAGNRHISEPPVFRSLSQLTSEQLSALSPAERVSVNRTARAGEHGTTFFADGADFRAILSSFWNDSIPPAVYQDLAAARWRLSEDYELDSGIRFSRVEPDWFIGFSDEFLKCIARVDKNKRARVLDAIGRISEAPTTPYGDTIKPLAGDLNGLWRYRIGDDRLVYKPDAASKRVVLLAFSARGGVYE